MGKKTTKKQTSHSQSMRSRLFGIRRPILASSLRDLLTSTRLSGRRGDEFTLRGEKRVAPSRTSAVPLLENRSRIVPDRRIFQKHFPNVKVRTHRRSDLINSQGSSIKRPSLSPCATRPHSSPFLPSISVAPRSAVPPPVSSPPPPPHINSLVSRGGGGFISIRMFVYPSCERQQWLNLMNGGGLMLAQL